MYLLKDLAVYRFSLFNQCQVSVHNGILEGKLCRFQFVFLKSGVGKDLIINIILSLIFFIPGVLHALWLITKD